MRSRILSPWPRWVKSEVCFGGQAKEIEKVQDVHFWDRKRILGHFKKVREQKACST